MKNLGVLLVLAVLSISTVTSQVFSYKRQNSWQLGAIPSVGFFYGHTGVDDNSAVSVSDVFRWGAGLVVDAGVNGSRVSFSNRLRLEYQESHSTGQLPIRGPSTFEFTTRSSYKLLPDPAVGVDLAFQGGCYSALVDETNSDGETTRSFFDPAYFYEGLFFSRDDSYGQRGQFKTSFQIGYSLQQLVYKNEDRVADLIDETQSSAGYDVNGTGSTKGNGLTSFASFDYSPIPLVDEQGESIVAFNMTLNLKAFLKKPGFQDYADSRVEAFFWTSLSFYDLLDLVSGIEMIYDNAIAGRRELRTSVSLNFRYNIDLGGGY
jgi:hypothetical protein